MYGDRLLKAFMENPYDSYMVGGVIPFDKEEMKEKAKSFDIIKRKLEGSKKKFIFFVKEMT